MFCGGTPLSREHVYPQWLSNVLPEQLSYRGQSTEVVHFVDNEDGEQPLSTREVHQRFTDAVVKRACKTCNSGWMNDLETGSRRVLTKMMRGERCEIDFEDAKRLAAWTAKTCLMAQYTHPESVATPASYYEWLFLTKEPPPNMQIWAFPSAAQDWGVQMEHRGLLFKTSDRTQLSDPCNTHSTTIGLGQVVMFILGTTISNLFSEAFTTMLPDNGIQLWPQPSRFIWDPKEFLGDEDVWLLADLLPLHSGLSISGE